MRASMVPYSGFPNGVLAAFLEHEEHRPTEQGSFKHWLYKPLLYNTARQQLSMICPENGSGNLGCSRLGACGSLALVPIVTRSFSSTPKKARASW